MPHWTCPAKINLYLEVLGRRADGFHALETVFQTIGLADELTVESATSGGIGLTCDDPRLPVGADNLVHRAATAMAAQRPALAHLRLHLAKRVPHGAGLGGGSSDAATTLMALNQLVDDPLPLSALHQLALALGSDVPFFLLGGTAHALGRGEQLTPLPSVERQPLTVLMPEGAHCATPAVFKALTDDERGPRPERGAAWFREALAHGVDPLLANRLTGPARRLCPSVGALVDWLAAQRIPHVMTGSGAACIAFAHLDPPSGVRAWRTWTGGGMQECRIAGMPE